MRIVEFQKPDLRTVPNIPEDAIGWLEEALKVRDKTLKDLTMLANNRTGFKDNFNGEARTLSLRDNTEVEITLTNQVKGSPSGVIVLEVDRDEFWRYKWRRLDVNRIGFTIKFDTPPDDNEFTNVTIFILGV